jgi:hypothetical protein
MGRTGSQLFRLTPNRMPHKAVSPKPVRPKSRFKGYILLLGVMAALVLAIVLEKPLRVNWFTKKPDLQIFPNMQYVAQTESLYEIPLCQSMIVENWYDVRHCVVVEFSMSAKAVANRQDQLRSRIAANSSKIKDVIRSVVGSVHPGDIRDPGLNAVKSRVGQDMDQIVGAGLVEKILVPEWNSYTGYQ